MRLNVFRTLWQDPSKSNAEGFEEPSEARFRTILLTIAALVIPPVIFFVYFQTMFTSLRNPEAFDMAQLSRNLAHGQGFTTYFLRPLAMSPGHGFNSLRQPDMIHGPLYPFIQSLAFGILGVSDNTAAWVSGLFYLLLIPLVYTLGKRVFNAQVGLIVASLITVNALMLEYAVSGMHITLFIFLTTWLMLALYDLSAYVKEKGPDSAEFPKGKLVWIGVLCALLYLTDSIFIWFAPVVLFFVIGLGGARRLKYALFFLAPFLAMTLPWMIRNLVLAGNPVFGLRGMELWMDTKGHYPGDIAYRYASEDLAPGKELFRAIVHKILLSIGVVINNFPQVSASWILAFLLPSLLFRFTDVAAQSLRRVMMWCFLAILVGVLFFQLKMPTFVAIIPTMLVFSVAFLMHLVQQAQLRRSGIYVTSALVAIAAFYPLLSVTSIEEKLGDLNQIATAKELKGLTKRNEVVLSDQPWIVAWYGERPSLWMPAIDGKIGATQNQLGARWLFVTDNVTTYSSSWKMVYNNLQRWQFESIRAEIAHETDPSVQLPPPIGLAPQGMNVPLFEQLAPFQTTKQNPINIKGKRSLPVAFIADIPNPKTQVGMTTTSNKQFAP